MSDLGSSRRGPEGHALYKTHTLKEREEMRSTALLDSRSRILFQDTAALAAQIDEKGAHRTQIRRQHEEDVSAAAAQRAAAVALSSAIHDARRAATAETAAIWDIQRDKTLRREWDLSDPAQVRQARLPRDTRPLYETGLKAPASSLQTFDAEFLDDPSIPAARREELLHSLAGVEAERAMGKAAEAEDRARTAAVMASQVRAADALTAAIAARAAEERRTTRAVNDLLSATRAEVAAARVEEDTALAASAVARGVADPMLREDTRMAISAASPSRFRVDHFKGYPSTAVAAIREDNERVHAERLAVTAAAAEVKAAEDAATLERARAAAAVEATIAADRRDRAHAYYAELRAAADARRDAEAERRAEERARQFPTASGLLAGFGRSLK